MKLSDLIETSSSENLMFQIVREDTWNEYDTVGWYSRLLDPIKECEVGMWEAIAPDVIRVQLNLPM